MNQLCRVCGEPAAGFHFGAFTCEGCKSFFGRTCNNVSSLGDCKNGGSCVITRKNRTACKSCRLRKCLGVGMSKSGSRYGRRSNWFKIHCLLQDQQTSSTSADEKTQNILEELHLSKLKSENDDEPEIDREETSEEPADTSSPTVTSSDYKDGPFPPDVPVSLNLFNWLNQNNTIPPEALPLFATLSPFLLTSGIGTQRQQNAANFAQYYPYLISLLSGVGSTTNSVLDGPNLSISPFNTPCLDSADDSSERGIASPTIKEQKPDVFKLMSSAFTPQRLESSRIPFEDCIDSQKKKSPTEGQPCFDSFFESRFKSHKLESFISSSKVSETNFKKVIFDQKKQTYPLCPSSTSGDSKKRKLVDTKSDFEEVDSERHFLKRPQTNLKKYIHDLQNEPIDLSLKTIDATTVGTSIIPVSSCSSVLACSMTLTPISSYGSSPISDTRASNLDSSSELGEERSGSAIDLSCRG